MRAEGPGAGAWLGVVLLALAFSAGWLARGCAPWP